MRRPNWIVDLPVFFARRHLLRQKPPLLASVKLTYRCNLQCLPCPFHLRSGSEGDPMGWEQALTSLGHLKRLGTKIVVFEGGEPFLWRDGRRDLKDLVRRAQRLFPCVAVTTNGTFPLDCPSDVLWVSLDGLKATQDRLRSHSFDRVWANLQTARHPRLRVHMTLNRENWRETEAMLLALRSVPAIGGVTVQFFYPYGQGEASLVLSPEEREQAVEMLLYLKRRYPILNSTGCLKAMLDNRWRCHDDLLVNVDPDGSVTQGCYLKNRGAIDCRLCGFTPVAEASRALVGRPGSLLAGWRCYFG
ncbi:MAG: radical SAM protein [Deltaproteobacteria bacterium]|nr:radical SAM protein [Deltaproteobacteria bacterium]